MNELNAESLTREPISCNRAEINGVQIWLCQIYENTTGKRTEKISHYYLSWTLTHMVDCDCLSIYYLGREIKWETHEPHRSCTGI